MRIDAKGMYYRQLNEQVKKAVRQDGETEVVLENVNGQRYIGTGLKSNVKIQIHGVPGNDLGAFMDGPRIIVHSNAQDGVGNTMNEGRIIVHGNAGDVAGYAMRGGQIFVRGSVGYRTGIHMKEYMNKVPSIVVGGRAGDFFGEYMAGGVLVVLGLDGEGDVIGDYTGTGMHGGVIFVRGDVDDFKVGKEVVVEDLGADDEHRLDEILRDYCSEFGFDFEDVKSVAFKKLSPKSSRPYGELYVY